MHNKVTATRLEQLRVEYGFVYVTWKAQGQRLMFRICTWCFTYSFYI